MRNIWRNTCYQFALFHPSLPTTPLPSSASVCDRIRASISFGIAGLSLSHVHYDAAVAATAATATAACNLGAENRENRRVKMKRGSSQGKWGNVSSTHIYIGVSAHAPVHVQTSRCLYENSWLRKEAYPISDLSSRLLFFPASLSLTVVVHSESPCRSCPRIRSDLKRLRCRKTTCMQPSHGVN